MGVPLDLALGRAGFTLGHFPSSILCSTVGGWVAARSAGQCSGAYGKIEDMTVALECVTGRGEIVTLRSRAHGPDLVPLVVGSEGTLAIVTSAKLRLHPAPTSRGFGGCHLPHDRAGAGRRCAPCSRPAFAPRCRACTTRSTRCWRAREASAEDARGGATGLRGRRRASVPRGWAVRRCAPSCASPEALNELLHARMAARAMGGAMLVVIFEGQGEEPQRHIEERPPRRRVDGRPLGRRGGRASMARAPLRRELPAGSRVRRRRVRRHHGGRGALVQARRAVRGRATSAGAQRLRHGALQPRLSRRMLHLLLLRRQRRPGPREAAGVGRGVRGDVRPRVAGCARRGDRGGRHALAPPRRGTLQGAQTARRSSARAWRSCARSCARSIRRGILNPGNLLPPGEPRTPPRPRGGPGRRLPSAGISARRDHRPREPARGHRG